MPPSLEHYHCKPWPMHLPDALLSRVFVHVSFHQKRITLQIVCKAWNDVLKTAGVHWNKDDVRDVEAAKQDKNESKLLAWMIQRMQQATLDRCDVLILQPVSASPISLSVPQWSRTFDASNILNLSFDSMDLPSGLSWMTRLRELSLTDVSFFPLLMFEDLTLSIESCSTVLAALTQLQCLKLWDCKYDLMQLQLPSCLSSLNYSQEWSDCRLPISVTSLTALQELHLSIGSAEIQFADNAWGGFNNLVCLTRLDWVMDARDPADDTNSDAWTPNYLAAFHSMTVLRKLRRLRLRLPTSTGGVQLSDDIMQQIGDAFCYAFEHWDMLMELRFGVDLAAFDGTFLFKAPSGLFRLPKLDVSYMLLDATVFHSMPDVCVGATSLQRDGLIPRKHYRFRRCKFFNVSQPPQPLGQKAVLVSHNSNVSTATRVIPLQFVPCHVHRLKLDWCLMCPCAAGSATVDGFTAFSYFENVVHLEAHEVLFPSTLGFFTSLRTLKIFPSHGIEQDAANVAADVVLSNVSSLSRLQRLEMEVVLDSFMNVDGAVLVNLTSLTHLKFSTRNAWTDDDWAFDEDADLPSCCQSYFRALLSITKLTQLRHLDIAMPGDIAIAGSTVLAGGDNQVFPACGDVLHAVLQQCTRLQRLRLKLGRMDIVDVLDACRKGFMCKVMECLCRNPFASTDGYDVFVSGV